MNRFSCSNGRECAMDPSADRASYATLTMAVALLLGALCAASPASSALYKWTDANGRVVYSDQPPPGNVKVDTLSGPPPPANPDAMKELAAKEVESRKQQQDAAASAKKTAQQRVDAAKVAGTCTDARAELSRLSADQLLLYSVNEKGQAVYMDDTERRRRREKLETFLKSNCP